MVWPLDRLGRSLSNAPDLLQVLTLLSSWPARRPVAAGVCPEKRQVRMREVRSGVSRVAGPRAAIPCRRWVRGSDLCNADVAARHLPDAMSKRLFHAASGEPAVGQRDRG